MTRAIRPMADPDHLASDDSGSRPAPPKREEYPVRRPLKRPPVHPGALMREILDDHVRLTIAEAAPDEGVAYSPPFRARRQCGR
ncbi:MAG TPA: hypothetical protein VH230_03595 [Stellaceae bacterium]|jgi:hypothetical protein|nr:hypothetical protein [Stellaceae bacterium]